MDMVLELKFTQNPKLMSELLKTGDAILVEVDQSSLWRYFILGQLN